MFEKTFSDLQGWNGFFVEFGVKNLWSDDLGLQRSGRHFMKCLIEMEFTMRSCFLIEIRRINLYIYQS